MHSRRLLLLAVLAGMLLTGSATAALAKSPANGYVSTGQSAAAQYTEDVPTAGGNTSVQNVHPTHRPSAIPSSTLTQLRRTPAGAAAAGLADALAPRAATQTAPRSQRRHRIHPSRRVHHRPRRALGATTPPAAGSAAIEAAQAVPGGSGSSDTVFILVLVAILVLISATGVLRLRRRS